MLSFPLPAYRLAKKKRLNRGAFASILRVHMVNEAQALGIPSNPTG